MVYSEVVNNGWILPKKAKYTMVDVDSVLTDSLFGKYGKSTLSLQEAKFIVKASATHHDTACSVAVFKNQIEGLLN